MNRSSSSGWLLVVAGLVLLLACVLSLPAEQDPRQEYPTLADGASVHEEVIVETSLNVRKPSAASRQKHQQIVKREIRHDHVTHGTSHVNRLESPKDHGKGQPHLGKHHVKVVPNWKRDNAAKLDHGKQ